MKRTYEHLASFLRAWFHQDFDLAGETLAEIVAAFKRSADPKEVRAIRADIDDFVNDHRDDLDDAFEASFDLDIDPTGFAPSTRSFLDIINEQLAHHQP